MITITQHERNEWSRLAQDAYRTGHNAYGHRFSAAAACWPERVSCAAYDRHQAIYRAWLLTGWRDVPELSDFPLD